MPIIYALSSGVLPCAVAIIRLSGAGCQHIAEKMLKKKLEKLTPRKAILSNIYNWQTGELLDKGLIFYYPAPNSFTGETMLEFHCHGSVAVVDAILESLAIFPDTQMAKAGEFSRRAFENGKLDLTQLEGLADIINSQTQYQRQQAMQQANGALRNIYEAWRKKLIKLRAHIEASLDFSEAEDTNNIELKNNILQLIKEIKAHINESQSGEQIREGYKIVLAGKANSGKSSLLNALAKREVAIVAKTAGTTRDIIEINLNIGGYLVKLLDTAGIRSNIKSNNKIKIDEIEKIGIERAIDAQKNADMILWLHASDDKTTPNPPKNAKIIFSKSDLAKTKQKQLSISVKEKAGLLHFKKWLESQLKQQIKITNSPILTRQRHKNLLTEVLKHLSQASQTQEDEMQAEFLRLAGDCLARLTGRIDVEELLEVIFKEFCIGK